MCSTTNESFGGRQSIGSNSISGAVYGFSGAHDSRCSGICKGLRELPLTEVEGETSLTVACGYSGIRSDKCLTPRFIRKHTRDGTWIDKSDRSRKDRELRLKAQNEYLSRWWIRVLRYWIELGRPRFELKSGFLYPIAEAIMQLHALRVLALEVGMFHNTMG